MNNKLCLIQCFSDLTSTDNIYLADFSMLTFHLWLPYSFFLVHAKHGAFETVLVR